MLRRAVLAVVAGLLVTAAPAAAASQKVRSYRVSEVRDLLDRTKVTVAGAAIVEVDHARGGGDRQPARRAPPAPRGLHGRADVLGAQAAAPGGRPRRRVPAGRLRLPRLRGDGRRAQRSRGRPPDASSRAVSIGTSYQGREHLRPIKITDNVGTDENEPEVLFNAHQHAREHLTVEMALYLLNQLHRQLRHRLADHQPRQQPRDLDRLRRQPGRRRVRHRHRLLPVLAQEPPAQLRLVVRRHRPEPQLGYHWGCCGGSSGTPQLETYRGPSAFSAPETQGVRDFVNSRGGRRRAADQGEHRLPHLLRAGAVALRLHDRQHRAAAERRRPGDVRARSASRWPPPTATRPSRPATCTSPTGRSTTGCGATTRSSLHLRDVPGRPASGLLPARRGDRARRPPATARRC